MMIKVGQGFDVHQLVNGRKCIIGGVEIPFHKGLDGHSDADVLLHAITDAILGAAGLGDIGKGNIFKNTNNSFNESLFVNFKVLFGLVQSHSGT